jgi:SAM-dependent methyltransferase
MAMNKLLTDKDRNYLKPSIELMWVSCPEMMKRKIGRANIQQGFVLSEIVRLVKLKKDAKILSVGCFEDTAFETIKKLGYDAIGIDPAIDFDLHSFLNGKTDLKYGFDIVFSTSVLEHVKDDEEFIQDMCTLLNKGGYGILTVDFNNDYKVGDKLPHTDLRFYTKYDLEVRLNNVLKKNNCTLVDKPEWEGKPEFTHDGCIYSFATFVFRKLGNV